MAHSFFFLRCHFPHNYDPYLYFFNWTFCVFLGLLKCFIFSVKNGMQCFRLFCMFNSLHHFLKKGKNWKSPCRSGAGHDSHDLFEPLLPSGQPIWDTLYSCSHTNQLSKIMWTKLLSDKTIIMPADVIINSNNNSLISD